MTKHWRQQYESYIARWPNLLREYRTMPEWHKNDCANAMKWWLELGVVT